MHKESIKSETREKPRAQENLEAQRSVESSKEAWGRIMSEAEKETDQFKKKCEDDFSRVEVRAEKDGLSVDNEDKEGLHGLSQEADVATAELIAEIGENKTISSETEMVANSREIKDFSKRYASFKRSEVASQIWQMRKDYQEKKKEVGEKEAEKAKLSTELEIARVKAERIEKVIAGMEKDIQEQKSKIWYKFTNLFKKGKLDDEKILEIAQEKLSETEKEMQEKVTMLEETSKAILESVDLEDGKIELENFYHEQGEIKNQFEQEREQRDLAKISKEKGVLFVHGLPLDNLQMNNTSENNAIIDTREVSAQDKIQMILGLEPTLSTSTVNEKAQYNKGMMYPFGVILKGGGVVSAYRGDAGTETQSLYARKSKYDKSLNESVIQKDISKKVEEAIENPLAPGTITNELSGFGFNEIVVENPKVAGLYVNLENGFGKNITLSKIKEISEQLGLSVFGLKQGKMFDLINGGKEISTEDVLESKKDLSPQEKLAMAEESIESVFSSSIPLEAKRKIEILKKEATFSRETKLEHNDEMVEINLLDAKGIEFREKIANWAEKIFSSGEIQDGNSLTALSKEQLKGDAPVSIERTFRGKTREECGEIIKKFKEDADKINDFFDRKNNDIQF